MPRQPDLDEHLTFRLTRAGGGSWEHFLEVFYDGTPVGGMTWNAGTGELHQITILSAYRRRGLATALWRHARGALPRGVRRPVHSGRRTPAGDG